MCPELVEGQLLACQALSNLRQMSAFATFGDHAALQPAELIALVF
jgi:hypothetical protein